MRVDVIVITLLQKQEQQQQQQTNNQAKNYMLSKPMLSLIIECEYFQVSRLTV